MVSCWGFSESKRLSFAPDRFKAGRVLLDLKLKKLFFCIGILTIVRARRVRLRMCMNTDGVRSEYEIVMIIFFERI